MHRLVNLVDQHLGNATIYSFLKKTLTMASQSNKYKMNTSARISNTTEVLTGSWLAELPNAPGKLILPSYGALQVLVKRGSAMKCVVTPHHGYIQVMLGSTVTKTTDTFYLMTSAAMNSKLRICSNCWTDTQCECE